jgi:SAM-dependent methyltransferase
MGVRATVFRRLAAYEGPGARWWWAMGTLMHKPVYPHVAAALDLHGDDRLLDVACGQGVFLAEQAAGVGRVAGVDASGAQVAAARRNLADRLAAGTAEIVHGDAVDLPWPDGAFTKVACMGSLEFMSDPAAVLAEMYRVLHPGGRAAVTMGERGVEQTTPGERDAWGLPIWGDAPARQVMGEAGFVDVTVTFVDWRGAEARLVIGTKR